MRVPTRARHSAAADVAALDAPAAADVAAADVAAVAVAPVAAAAAVVLRRIFRASCIMAIMAMAVAEEVVVAGGRLFPGSDRRRSRRCRRQPEDEQHQDAKRQYPNKKSTKTPRARQLVHTSGEAVEGQWRGSRSMWRGSRETEERQWSDIIRQSIL